MDAIGGYFELELRKGEHYHKNALRLNTARNCFEYVLRARKYTKVYMPYYTCEVMFQPLDKLGVDYEYYHINIKFEIVDLPVLKAGEAILYTNYFALKQDYVEELSRYYGNRLIIDNAQAFYAERIAGIDTFYSARKFFGVPDGAYLYTDLLLDEEFEQDISLSRISHLIKRIEFGAESGYMDFRTADDSLDNQPIKRMSRLTDALLSNVDYETSIAIRRRNFTYIHEHLKGTNRIDWIACSDAIPLCYPYLSDVCIHKALIEDKIFIPKYWHLDYGNDIGSNSLEKVLEDKLLPCTIDQRQSLKNIQTIIDSIKFHE